MFSPSRSAVFIALIAAALVGFGTPSLAQNVKIGALMPLTGPLARYGNSSLNGVNLAAIHINAQGGLLDGRTLEIVVGDTETNPQSGVEAARQLVRGQGVSGLIGALASDVSISVATAVSAVDGVVQSTGASTSPMITNLADNDFLFRTTPHTVVQGHYDFTINLVSDVANGPAPGLADLPDGVTQYSRTFWVRSEDEPMGPYFKVEGDMINGVAYMIMQQNFIDGAQMTFQLDTVGGLPAAQNLVLGFSPGHGGMPQAHYDMTIELVTP